MHIDDKKLYLELHSQISLLNRDGASGLLALILYQIFILSINLVPVHT